MKLTYWVAQWWGIDPGHDIIDKTKRGAQEQVAAAKIAGYSPVTKRTIEFKDSFDLFQQATAPEGGRGMGEQS